MWDISCYLGVGLPSDEVGGVTDVRNKSETSLAIPTDALTRPSGDGWVSVPKLVSKRAVAENGSPFDVE
jgi:hypothetical protein